ncbi:hypothetical protein J4410_02745 [Candidatus Woesearchaeota archaeon]|nr:hypothetical protein [Candidatus Woesearchaeota archaeon]
MKIPKEKIVQEGKARIVTSEARIPSKKMPVFYNPVMQTNRDITILLLNAIPDKAMRIADPLAGTGIRSIRFCKELDMGKIHHLFLNDQNEKAVLLIKENLFHNKLNRYDENNEEIFKNKEKKQNHHIHIYQKDANQFLWGSSGFDYIDIDPFGSPNPFLDIAVQRLSRGGILAVTATDTSCLAGTYPQACMRKYWALPLRTAIKHEIGLRILIRKVQLIAAQYEKALTPIYSYSHEHYMRIFFRMEKSKTACDTVLQQQGMVEGAGPLWNGALWDIPLAKKIAQAAEKIMSTQTKKLTALIAEESSIPSLPFYDIHEIAKKEKIKSVPSFEKIRKAIETEKHKVVHTHFSHTGIRTTMKKEHVINLLKKLS